MSPILDFNNQDGATIEIPQIQKDYSLIINHFTKPSTFTKE